jgi:hypothetical protein
MLTADADGRFHSTPLLETLRKDSPGSMRGLALATTLPAQRLAWNDFTAAIEIARRGHSDRADVIGGDFFVAVPPAGLVLVQDDPPRLG